uniref:Uncharacterized sensor-like histidine kinase ycf26 n=1 Tax=Gastroclonium compressum TaxID=1852973 RepID=A0A173FZU7_GASCM|nr:sensor-like histidine kinase ycf26 [Coeloseira compressa]ANH09555.1 sensor-like histidine kinase ycf26 [Coeloseira compressa]
MSIISYLIRSWSKINLKTRLTVLVMLIISSIMSSLIFWALNIIQEDSVIRDIQFCKDLGTLFASNIVNLINTDNPKELASLVEKIYLTTSSIRYILLFHVDGTLYFTLPIYSVKVNQLLHLNHNVFQFEQPNFLFDTPLLQYNKIFHDNITDIIIPLTKSGYNLGTLNLGINSNSTLSSSTQLISTLSIVIFVFTWIIIIISIALNTWTFRQPMNELLSKIQDIGSGDFTQRFDLASENELGDLMLSFNEMAEKLEFYEKNNISKLIAAKQKLETIVSIIGDGILLVDSNLRLVYVNQAAIKAFDWFTLDIAGQCIYNYLPAHVNDALVPILIHLIKCNSFSETGSKVEELCIKLDYSSQKVFRFVVTSAVYENSQILAGVVIILQDITREVSLNEAKNQFISNISHELRTPLCNIGSFLETLLDYNDSLSQAQKVEFLNIANNETKRLSSLVNDILDLSYIESKYIYKLKSTNIYRLLYDILQSSYIRAKSHSINLKLEFDSSIQYILAHESSLVQVVANLLSNAIKFTYCKGLVVIRVYNVACSNKNNRNSYSPTITRIEVIDEGIGIDQRYQKSVFDRFVRIENNVHTLEGTGLGLSIVKSIIEKHKTKIMINSYVNVGTSFWFDLIHVVN